ncbi:MAG TPA: UDP-N-acetylmuramoyl-L-alanine--D-glutamate ligase [Bacillota bacterium]|nr:UDP-N-acetylmuramoyl-L-alanine--D-glutamate ligase [Bacillota bacterium]
MDVTGLKVLVVGMARSGVAAARFLQEKGALVTITDAKNREAVEPLATQLEEQGIWLALGSYPEISGFQLVVTSPGVPLTVPPIQAAYQAKVPVIGEIELAYRFAKAPLVAITGTNGKTTTTTLIGEMFRTSGTRVCVAGNIGLPLVQEIENCPQDSVVVVEVSSFQLETIDTFRPKASLLLNITPDHLDRHGTLENYAGAKARIMENQQATDFTVLNYDDSLVAAMAPETKGQVIFFSRTHTLTKGVFVRDDQVVIADGSVEIPVLPAAQIRIPGAHNLENALGAVAVGWAMGLSPEVMAATLKEFPGVAHRLEFVGEVAGVRYINDSKGTNPDASIKALEAYREPIVLIAGGYDKGSDFTEFAEKMVGRVRSLVVVGQVAEKVAQAAAKVGITDIVRAQTFPQTVELAARKARPGDIVLLSPACASWGMFNNFEERGDLFRQLVKALN